MVRHAVQCLCGQGWGIVRLSPTGSHTTFVQTERIEYGRDSWRRVGDVGEHLLARARHSEASWSDTFHDMALQPAVEEGFDEDGMLLGLDYSHHPPRRWPCQMIEQLLEDVELIRRPGAALLGVDQSNLDMSMYA